MLLMVEINFWNFIMFLAPVQFCAFSICKSDPSICRLRLDFNVSLFKLFTECDQILTYSWIDYFKLIFQTFDINGPVTGTTGTEVNSVFGKL
jgi:hypothetical protein